MNGRDYFEIQNLINLYFKLQDEGAFEELAELFSDAVFHFHGRAPIVRDAAKIADIKRQNVAFHGSPPSPCTRHAGQNIIITPGLDGTATAWSSVIVFQATPSFPLQPIIAVSYDDKFAVLEGRWRFTERVMRADLLGDLSQHLLSEIAPVTQKRG